jgi:hypothetical protein
MVPQGIVLRPIDRRWSDYYRTPFRDFWISRRGESSGTTSINRPSLEILFLLLGDLAVISWVELTVQPRGRFPLDGQL